jgi:hypothetical protein
VADAETRRRLAELRSGGSATCLTTIRPVDFLREQVDRPYLLGGDEWESS